MSKRIPRDLKTGHFIKQLVYPAPGKRKVTGLAFSGAGAKILIEIGAAKAIRKLGISPDILVGTSSGAITSAFFAANQLDLLEDICRTVQNKDIYSWAPWLLFTKKAAFLDNAPLGKLLSTNLDCNAIREYGNPVLVNTTDLATWTDREYDLTKGTNEQIVDWILESTSVPGSFPIRNNAVDGGVVDNYPIFDALAQEVDRVILIVTSKANPTPINNFKDLMFQMVSVVLYNQLVSAKRVLELVHIKNPKIELTELITIEPDVPVNIPLLNINKIGDAKARQKIIDLGYNIAMKTLKDKV